MQGHPAYAEHKSIRGLAPKSLRDATDAARALGFADEPSLAGHVDDYAADLGAWLDDEAAGHPDIAHF